MSRRVLLTSALIALILGFIFLAPGLPPVRSALVDWALRFAGEAGVDVHYDRAEGNAWRRIELHGVSLAGLGADVHVERLELAYHLPSLLGGELPLSLAARGVSGTMDLSALEQLADDMVEDGGGAGLPVRLVLREVDLKDVQLSSENSPYYVPDATLTDLTVVPEPGALVLGARVVTDHGSVSAEGRLALPSFSLTGTITHGDVSVARYWWEGATAGTVSGPFSWRRGQLNADLRMVGGQIDQSGIEVNNIGGTVSMRYPVITAVLAGEGLDGPVTAEGTVNIAGLNYHATGTATPQLAAAAAWLSESFGLEAGSVPATGSASVNAVVSGWALPTVRLDATAQGSLAGLPLDQLSATLNTQVGGSLRAELGALLAGGTVDASIAPSALGSRLEFLGRNLDLQGLDAFGLQAGGVVQEVSGQVELADTPAGTATARWAGELSDHAATLDVDGRLDADGLQAFFVAEATPAGQPTAPRALNATGAVVYADQRLDAGVSIADLNVPGINGPLRLGLTAQGPVNDLLLSATVENDSPVLLDVAWLQPGGPLAASDQIDARGSVTGRLQGDTISNIVGSFGPVALSGSVGLAPVTANLGVAVAPLTMRVGDGRLAEQAPGSDEVPAAREAPVHATLAGTSGALTYANGVLALRAASGVESAQAGTARLDLNAIDSTFELVAANASSEAAASWSYQAVAQGERARFTIDSSGAPYELTFADLPVYLGAAPRPAQLSGSLTPGANGDLNVVATLLPDSSLAGVTLVNGATLTGAILPAAQRLELEGAVGQLPVSGQVSWAQAEVQVEAVVLSPDPADAEPDALSVAYTPATGGFTLAGAAPLAPLLAELGYAGIQVDYVGQLAFSVPGGYSGAGRLHLENPVPLDLQLIGQGTQLDLRLEGELGGVPLEGGGSITEPLIDALASAFGSDQAGSPNLLVNVGPLQGLVVDVSGVRGEGRVAAQALGPASLGPVPWALDFDWASAAGSLAVGGEDLQVSLSGGVISAAGALAAPVTYGGSQYALTVWPGLFPGDGASGSSVPDFVVGGRLSDAGGQTVATVAGTLEQLTVQLDASLEELAAALPAEYQPRGRLSASATVNVLSGPTYEGRFVLAPDESSVILGSQLPEGATSDEWRATFAGVGGAFELSVDGAGLEVDRTPDSGSSGAGGSLRLVAQEADFGRFLPQGFTGVLDGALSYGVTGWRGQLEARVAAPAPEGAEPELQAMATLTGAFSTLDLALTGHAPAATTFSAAGPLLPSPDVTGRIQVGEDLVTGTFDWNAGFVAHLASARRTFGGAMTLPALAATLTVDEETGTVALRSTPDSQAANAGSIDVELRDSQLVGGLTLPLSVNDVPLEVNAAVSGTLAEPQLQAQVVTSDQTSAPLAEVVGDLQNGATLQAAVPRWLLQQLLPSAANQATAFLGEEVTAVAKVEPGGAFSASLRTRVAEELTGASAGLELALAATGTVAGSIGYEGEVQLEAVGDPEEQGPRTVAVVPFAGTGPNANARLDLAEVDWQALGAAIGTPLNISGTGLFTLNTQPLAASLTVDLAGAFGDNAVSLRGTAPADLYLTLEGPAGHLEGSLAWAPELVSGGEAHLTGQLAGRPVELNLSIDDGLTTGELNLQAVGANLKAQLWTASDAQSGAEGTQRRVSVTADVPPGSWAAFGGSAEAELVIGGAQVTLSHLVASIDGLLGEPSEPLNRLSLVAAGPLTSGLRVRGLLTSPRLQESMVLELSDAATRARQADPANWAAHETAGVGAQLRWRDLVATASWQEGLTVNVAGSAATTDLTTLLRAAGGVLSPALISDLANLAPRLQRADLTWHANEGWHGGLEGRAALPWVPTLGPVELRAEAETGALRLVAGTDVAGGVARLNVLVPAREWLTAPLSGSLEVDLPSELLLPDLGVPLQVRSAALVEGTVAAPRLSGSLLVSGAVTAQGTYGYADGTGFLSATGPDLTITGHLGADGAFAQAQVTAMAVEPCLPQLQGGRLSLDARFSGAQISVDSIELTGPNSTLKGRATVGLGGAVSDGPRFSAALDANVDLSDVALGDVQLTGTVRGPLVISSADLRDLTASSIVANLAALHVGTAGLGWSVSGNLTVGGTLADPVVATQLTGDGDLRGLLTVSTRPAAREYAITSTLSLGQVSTDLRVDMGNGATLAAGSVRVGDGLVLVAHEPSMAAGNDQRAGGEPPAATDLVMTGAGRFAGLSARLSGDLSALRLTGDLGTLGGSVAGQVQLTADARADTWLLGEVTGAEVGGVALEPLTISAVSLGSPVLVQSSDLRATVDPTSLEWTLAASDFHLGDAANAPTLTVWGRGSGATGTLDASVAMPDVNLDLEVRLDGEATVLLEGVAYGGELLVTGARSADAGTWTGSGRYAGGHLAGFDLSAQVALLGVGLVPTLVLNTRAQNGLVVNGNASLGVGGLTVDQFLAGAPLEQTLRLQGSLFPRTDLTLSTLDLPAGASVTAAGAARATTSSVHLTSVPSFVPESPTSLRANGQFELSLGPARLELGGEATPPLLSVALTGLPRWRAEGQLLAANLLDLVQQVLAAGLTLEGTDDAKGLVHVDPSGPHLRLEGFGLELAGVNLEATGQLGLNEANVTGTVLVRTDLPVAERETGYVFPWSLTTAGGLWQLESNGAHGFLSAEYGVQHGAGALAVSADLDLSDGSIEAQLGLQDGGVSGALSVSSIRLLSPELGPLTIDAEATVADGRVGGSATLGSEAGSVVLNGAWGLGGLLPAAVSPDAPTGGRLEARVRALELSAIPLLAEQVPELHGQVTGTAQLRDGFVFGQLVAQQIGVADLNTPMQLSFSGRPADITLDLQLRGALGRANLAGGNLSGMFRLERFPLNLVSTAVVGPADFSADLTGVMRFDGPLSAPQNGYLRLATEEVRLERMGVTTLGNVTVTFDQQALLVEKAEFEGLGSWRAFGELRSDNFDFHLEADQADFTPLLGLVPQFARLGVGAIGSFDLSVLGDAANPSIELTSPDLRVDVAGTSYRLQRTQLDLDGVTLSVSSRVQGLAPITGDIEVEGQALLSLFPFTLGGTHLTLVGQADISTFGRMTGLSGTLQQLPDGTPTVRLEGLMGQQPMLVEGTLAPLDLRAAGSGVTMRLPSLLVDRAVVNADLRLVAEPGGVALSGSVAAEEVIVDPAVRRPAVQAPAEEAEAASPDMEPIAATEAPPPAAAAPRSGGLAALRFDDLVIRAPGRVTLTTNVGAFEAGLDLVLSGTGAEPRLAGTASAIRGNLRFGGRDFTIDRAVATFTPNRGVFPELDVAAHAEFDKQRVVSAAPNVSFAAPREGGTFDVRLAFFGPLEPTPGGGFRFDIQPILSSNAMIEVEGQGASRPFTEAELMALVTLGRFELNADLIGAGGLGEAVATGALDTAIDLLVVSGLESALREALGLDVVEIRTTSLSTLLDDGGQPFGVSLRVGGYLHPELFASYRIGTYDGSDPDFAITNEVLLRYGLGPLDLDVIGRIDIPAAGTAGQARPEIGVILGYQFSPWLGVDGGVTVSPVRSLIEFGVTIRW